MSEFGRNSATKLSSSAEEELALHPDSPYRFLLTRVYGRLHFVKQVKPEKMSDPVYSIALAKEFEIGYALEHPHIVKYLQYADGAVYQEYVDGSTLATLSDNDDPCLKGRATVIRILSEILDALGYLHSNGIAYLDLKPQNVMLTRIGHSVRIVDLGSCVSGMHDSTPGFTKSYASPEQLDDRPSDGRTDLYQFGLIARDLLAGCGLEKQYRDFIDRCLAESPDDRFDDAHAALEALTLHDKRRKIGYRKATYCIAAIFIIAAATFGYTSLNGITGQGLTSDVVNPRDRAVAESGSEESTDSAASVVNSAVNHAAQSQAGGVAGPQTSAISKAEEANWSAHGYFTDIRIPPEGHPRRKEVMHIIMEKSVELEVSSHYSNTLHPVISDYRKKGLTYKTLDGQSKASFDSKLDSIDRLVENLAGQAAETGQYEGVSAEELRSLYRKQSAECRKEALGFKL